MWSFTPRELPVRPNYSLFLHCQPPCPHIFGFFAPKTAFEATKPQFTAVVESGGQRKRAPVGALVNPRSGLQRSIHGGGKVVLANAGSPSRNHHRAHPGQDRGAVLIQGPGLHGDDPHVRAGLADPCLRA